MINKVFERYLSTRVLPIWLILIFDVAIIAVSCFLAYVLRYDVKSIFLDPYPMVLISSIAWITGVNIVFFRLFRTYSNVLRFSSFVDIIRIVVSLSLAYGLLGIMSVFFEYNTSFYFPSFSILLMTYVINLAMMISFRVVVKTVYDSVYLGGKSNVNVFIYGAKEVGINIAKSIRVGMQSHYRLRGFIADEPELIGKVMMGVPVYANNEKLIEHMEEHRVKTLIVSPAKMENFKKKDMADALLDHNVRLLAAPPLSDWNGKELATTEIKKIEIEDLLERDPIDIDIRKIAFQLEGKRVMITGAAGSIGSEIMRQVVRLNPFSLILVDQAETPLHDVRLELQDDWRSVDAKTIVADITNASRMEVIFKEYKPQYIFHAAAYKHVPMMEDNVSEAIQVNVGGTRIIADLAVKHKVEKFVMISTDKAVNPTNVMGCSKRIAEIYVQSLARKLSLENKNKKYTSFITTRFGNVLGSNGSVIPRFRKQITDGGPVTVTHPEIIRYFMTIPEACKLVLEAGGMGSGGEIYIFDMGEPVKILDLAKRMIKLSGRTEVKIEFTGLRHGEKLYEELLNVKEQTEMTYHDKIMIANVRQYDYETVKEMITELVNTTQSYDSMKIVGLMKELVPEFISKNSLFEELDHKNEKQEDHKSCGELLDHPSELKRDASSLN
ncbi:MAG: polysaccharide biosynthesis protein [Bacteroides sp.]|nr:polysaccharide biosynthesis protein [Bacteroides sp.]